MKTRMLIAVMLAALIAAAGCERKAEKADDNGATEQKADTAAAEKTEPKADATAEKAEQAGIPTVTDEELNPLLLDPAKATQGEAPETFKAKFITSEGDFVVEFHKEWAPIGANRAYNLIKADFYDGIAFFRVVQGFMAQFGIHANPKVSEAWKDATIEDDPVKKSNTRGMVSFAKRPQPNTRLTHLFINYGDNSALDEQGFAPVGKVVEGMEVVDKLYSGYGGGPPTGPSQGTLTAQGNPYLQKEFPELDYIKDVVILGDEADAKADAGAKEAK
jgi:peptidyl-prolyl cis-trans isomerase A (cyclophilin A)